MRHLENQKHYNRPPEGALADPGTNKPNVYDYTRLKYDIYKEGLVFGGLCWDLYTSLNSTLCFTERDTLALVANGIRSSQTPVTFGNIRQGLLAAAFITLMKRETREIVIAKVIELCHKRGIRAYSAEEEFAPQPQNPPHPPTGLGPASASND